MNTREIIKQRWRLLRCIMQMKEWQKVLYILPDWMYEIKRIVKEEQLKWQTFNAVYIDEIIDKETADKIKSRVW